MRHRKTLRTGLNAPEESIASANQIIEPFGDGTALHGLAENSRSAIPQPVHCSAKSSSCARSRSTRRSIAGTSSAGCLRKRTARPARGTRKQSNVKTASAFPRSGRILRAANTSIASRSKARAANLSNLRLRPRNTSLARSNFRVAHRELAAAAPCMKGKREEIALTNRGLMTNSTTQFPRSTISHLYQSGDGLRRNYVWGTMLAWRATSCQRPCCFIQMAVKRRFSTLPALGIFPPQVTVSLPATMTVSP